MTANWDSHQMLTGVGSQPKLFIRIKRSLTWNTNAWTQLQRFRLHWPSMKPGRVSWFCICWLVVFKCPQMFLMNSHVEDHCCKLSKSWSPLSTPTPWSSVGSWDWSYCGFQGSQDQKERLTGGMKRWGEKFSASTKVSCQNRENKASLKWQWLRLDQDLVTLFRALFYSSLSLACWASVAEICHPPLISNQVPP